MMLAGVLDAFDLTVIARCSRETRDAVAFVWEGVRAGNPATRLCSVERLVQDRALNKTGFKEYVPLSQAADCVMCGTRTRYRHPVEGSMLCAPCGKRGEKGVVFGSPFFRFRMMDEYNAKKVMGISRDVDLGKHLRYAARRAWAPDPNNTYYWKYAPAFAITAKIALDPEAHERARARFRANKSTARVFLQRDVICLLQEKFGGPRMLNERLRNQALPRLDLAKPDE